MPGTLSFQITADAAQYVQAVTQSTAVTSTLGETIQKISTRTSPAFSAGVASSARTLNLMRDSAQTTREATSALSSAMILLGTQAAPQLTGGVLAATNAIKGLRSISALLGVGLGGGGILAGGLAAGYFLWSEGIKAVNAELDEMKSHKALIEQFEHFRPKLVEMIDLNVRLGKIDFKEGTGLKNELTNANTPETRQKALSDAQGTLSYINLRNIQAGFAAQLGDALKELKISGMEGPERQKADFLSGMDKTAAFLLDLAKKAGADEGPIIDLINGVTKSGLDRIDAENATDKDEKDKASLEPRTPPNVTALEKIGLIIGGPRSAKDDNGLKTALNTQRMIEVANKQLDILKQLPSLLTGGGLKNI